MMNLRIIIILMTIVASKSVLGEKTSVLDLVPIVSQIKGGVQMIFGDCDEALSTQDNFLNYGIGVAQLRSVYYLMVGDFSKAWKIQEQSMLKLEPVIDELPVVGHVKGMVHFIMGDGEHGWEAIKAATSNLVLSLFAIAKGGIIALVGRLLSDIMISAIESCVIWDWRLYGLPYYVWNIGHLSVGKFFDVAIGLALDIFVGNQLYNCYQTLGIYYERLQQFVGDIDGDQFSPLVNADHNSQPNLSNTAIDSYQYNPLVSATINSQPNPSEIVINIDKSNPLVSTANNVEPNILGNDNDSDQSNALVYAINNEQHNPSAMAINSDQSNLLVLSTDKNQSIPSGYIINNHQSYPLVSATNKSQPNSLKIVIDNDHSNLFVSVTDKDQTNPSLTVINNNQSNFIAPAEDNDEPNTSIIAINNDQSNLLTSVTKNYQPDVATKAINSDQSNPIVNMSVTAIDSNKLELLVSAEDHGQPKSSELAINNDQRNQLVSATNNGVPDPSVIADDQSNLLVRVAKNNQPNVDTKAINSDQSNPSVNLSVTAIDSNKLELLVSAEDHGQPKSSELAINNDQRNQLVSATNNGMPDPSVIAHDLSNLFVRVAKNDQLNAATKANDSNQSNLLDLATKNGKPKVSVKQSVSFAKNCKPGPSVSASDTNQPKPTTSDTDNAQPKKSIRKPYKPPRSARIHIPRPGVPMFYSDDYQKFKNKNKVERDSYTELQEDFMMQFNEMQSQLNKFMNQELPNYRYSKHLNVLDINLIKRGMTYLSKDVKSLITSDEFRTININMKVDYECSSIQASLGGLLKMNLDKVMSTVAISYNLNPKYYSENAMLFLESCKKTGFLDFSVTSKFVRLDEVHAYMKEKKNELQNKSLILCQHRFFSNDSHSVVLKYKIVGKELTYVLVDYTKPGLLQKDAANPYRFEFIFDIEEYTSFQIFDITFNENAYLKYHKLTDLSNVI